MLLAASVMFITLHMIDGEPILVNPRRIVSMRKGREDDDPRRMFPKEVDCVIFLADGRYLSVDETCDEVQTLMEK